MCQLCFSEFSLTFRRHHCRACGKVVCGACSDNKAPLPYLKFEAARVCDECFDALKKLIDQLVADYESANADRRGSIDSAQDKEQQDGSPEEPQGGLDHWKRWVEARGRFSRSKLRSSDKQKKNNKVSRRLTEASACYPSPCLDRSL